MEPQSAAQGIMQTDEFDDALAYKVVCSCGHNAHEHNVWVEIEPDINEISVTVYTRLSSKQGFWRNIWQLFTKGYIEMETSLLMNRQQALNYSETLRSAIAHLSEKTQQK
jgi:hypothetical protein